MTAMNYLRKPPAHIDSKKTVVDVYVEKQMEYTRAQIEWDILQDKNAGTTLLPHAYCLLLIWCMQRTSSAIKA